RELDRARRGGAHEAWPPRRAALTSSLTHAASRFGSPESSSSGGALAWGALPLPSFSLRMPETAGLGERALPGSAGPRAVWGGSAAGRLRGGAMPTGLGVAVWARQSVSGSRFAAGGVGGVAVAARQSSISSAFVQEASRREPWSVTESRSSLSS